MTTTARLTFARRIAATTALGLAGVVAFAGTAGAESPAQNPNPQDLVFAPNPGPQPVGPGDLAQPQDDDDPDPQPQGPGDLVNPEGGDDPDPTDGPDDFANPEGGDDPDPTDGPDDLTTDPGCNVTHGDCDPGDDPDGGDEPSGSDETTDDPEVASSGGGRSSLPRTGAGLAALAGLGSLLTAGGLAARRFANRIER